MEIRKLTPEDAQELWDLRMTALSTEPQAFSASPEANHMPTAAAVAEQLGNGGSDNIVLGGFDGSRLIAMAGLVREPRPKLRHKARVWGVFVLASHRRQGVGRKLMTGILELCREMDGLQQVQISVVATQKAARSLYAALGFRSFGVEPRALQVDGEFLDEEHFYLPLA